MVAYASKTQPEIPVKKTKPQRWVSLEEYIKREARYIHKHEYLDGKIVRMPYAKGPHNEISMNIGTAIKNAVKGLSQKYRIFSSDQKIYFPELNHSCARNPALKIDEG